MLRPEPGSFDVCERLLAERYGPIEIHGPIVPWNHTDYYRDELGTRVARKFIFFQDPIDPEKLPEIKLVTNGIERSTAASEGSSFSRRFNIDPGYVTEAKVVLATTKDYAHRLYLAKGIYGEVELRYSREDRKYLPFAHTYPDFGDADALRLFLQARSSLRIAIMHMLHGSRRLDQERPESDEG